jgi:two-component system OmpR family response regulator
MLDLAARQLVAPDGVVIALSGAEFKLLNAFVEHPNRILDRNRLMDLTVGRDGTPFDRSIDVQVSRLRVRLRDDAREPRIIKTVRSEGYILAAVVERLD